MIPIVAFLIACSRPKAEEFTPPAVEHRAEAVGSLNGLGPRLKRTFSDGGDFDAKTAPKAMDWLAAHPEPGQTYWDYFQSSPALPRDKRTKLYLLPIGEFDKELAHADGSLSGVLAETSPRDPIRSGQAL